MKDCEFASVKRMVNYFYTGDYDAKPSLLTEEATQEMLVHVAMFTLADKYLVDGLRTLSQTKFKEAIKKQKQPSVIPQYVKPVYDLKFECRKRLRDAVVEVVRSRVTELPFDLDVKKILDDLMGEIPEFAKDLAMSYIQQPQYTFGLFARPGEKENPNPTTTIAAPKFTSGPSYLFD